MKGVTEEEKRERRRMLRVRAMIVLVIMLAYSLTPLGVQFWKQAFTDFGFDSRKENRAFEFVRVHVINVGKADAILLESGEHTALLDAGTGIEGENVADYLIRQGITRLDYVIASHPDSDHIGGIVQVMKEIPTDGFLRGVGWEEIGQEAEDLEAYLAENRVPSYTLHLGDTFTVGHAKLEVLGPVDTYESSNNNSLVLKLTCFAFSALFCGDAEKEAEQDLVDSGQDLSAHLLKVAHHGSRTSSTEEFMEAVSPQIAVVSVGPDNNNLPRSEALARLEAAGASLLRTDIDGDIIISYNGERIGVEKSHK